MRKQDVIKHYGSVPAIAKALNITRQAVYQWPELVPWRSALKLYELARIPLRQKDYVEKVW